MPNYKDSKIYKITCNITGLTYYGSTTAPISKRMSQHRCHFKSNGLCKSNLVLAAGDYDYCLVEKVECSDNTELHKRERFYIESKDGVNKHIPGRTQTEYYYANKGKILKQIKEYMDAHKEKISEYRAAHKEETAEYGKVYRAAHKEKKSEYNKQYNVENKEKKLEHRAAHKEETVEYNKVYRAAHKEKKSEYNEENKEKISEYNKQYNVENKDKISAKRSKKVTCDCGLSCHPPLVLN